MKANRLVALTLLGLATFCANFSHAGLLQDLDPPTLPLADTNGSYWTGSDYNALYNGQLKNSGDAAEEAWLEALLGKVYNDPSVNRIGARVQGFGENTKVLTDYDPGFSWEYAIVKYGNYWTAFTPDNNGYLDTPTFRYGVSHISFFRGHPVPEPAAVLLLGAGLIGLAVCVRKKLT